MSTSSFPCRRNGFAYLLVLVTVTLVGMAAVVLSRACIVRGRMAEADLRQTRCRQAALGTLRAATLDLGQDFANSLPPQLDTCKAEGEELGGCGVVLVGRDPLGLDPAFGPVPEAGKLNVNTASATTLAALPDMTLAIAAAIVDWRDADEVTDPNGGAEREAYSGAAVPYAPRNGPIEDIGELRMVRGVTDPLWFGEDANQNGILDPGEDRNHDGKLQRGLRDLLTPDTREPGLRPDGQPRQDVTAAPMALRALMQEKIGQERGTEAFDQARQHRPFLNRLAFCKAAGLTASEVDLLWPSISGAEGRVGLVDAWSAPEEVLSALLGQAAALRVIGARPLTHPDGPGWLVEAIGADDLAQWGGLVTSGSHQFTLDLVAFTPDGRGHSRLQAWVDCSTQPPRVAKLIPADNHGWPWPWLPPGRLPAGQPLSTTFASLRSGSR